VADVPFNPLDKHNLAESVAGALLRRPVGPLPPTKRVMGAGIYAIYYAGDFKAYRPVTELNRENLFQQPIYVGKAVPSGARKGAFGLDALKEPALFKRLNEHAKSIEAVENLKLKDFFCRYLVLQDDIWIPLGESLLIGRFQPLWNVLIEGFGIHTPGKGRKKQVHSKWDTLHPGRALAADLPPNPKTSAELQQIIVDFFAGRVRPTISPEEAVIREEEEQDE
jgi:Eco29kI restriction endonuclease